MIYGYARVSTDGQTLDAQIDALNRAGAAKIFREKISGAKTDRRELKRLVGLIGSGDVLLVTRLDRLARSTLDLLRILDQIAKRGASFKALADEWADTTTPTGRLLLTILGGIAEFERELIRTRTTEGRVRAKACGVKMGRAFKLTPHQQDEVLSRKAAGEAVREIARSYNVSPSTVSRLKGTTVRPPVIRRERLQIGEDAKVAAAQRHRDASCN